MYRQWINQPSTQQPLHKFHGRRVLTVPARPGVANAYFTEGDIISIEVPTNALSHGWPERKTQEA